MQIVFAKNRTNKKMWEIAFLLALVLAMVMTANSVVLAEESGLTVTLNSPAADLVTTDDTHVYNQVVVLVDPAYVHFTWDFGNGIDQNLYANVQQVTLINTDTNQAVPLNIGQASDYVFDMYGTCMVGDFKSTKLTNPKLRRLELILTSTTLDENTNYALTLHSGFSANNGNTLGKDYIWNFKTSGDDTAAPTWPEGSQITSSGLNGSGVTLSWTKASDDQAVTSYKVYQDGALAVRVNGATLTFKVTGLTAGNTYNFKVEAGNAVGAWSKTGPSLSVTTVADTTAPEWLPEAVLTAYAGTPSTIDLSWPAATDNVEVASYIIYRDGDFLSEVDGTILSYQDTGLQPETTYAYVIKAVDADGNLGASLGTSAATISGTVDTEAPTWPANPISNTQWTVTEATKTIEKWWNPATDNVGVVAYKVYKNDQMCATIPSTAELYFSDTVPLDGSPYNYKIEAGDAAGNWSTDGPAFVNGNDGVAPVWPAGSNVTASEITSNSVKLSWTAAQDNVDVVSYSISGPIGGIDGYMHTVTPYLQQWVIINDSKFVPNVNIPHPGLKPDKEYTFWVVPNDGSFNTGPPQLVTFKTAPEAGKSASTTMLSGIPFSMASPQSINLSINNQSGVLNKIITPVNPVNAVLKWGFDQVLSASCFDKITLVRTDNGQAIPITAQNLIYTESSDGKSHLELNLARTGIVLDDSACYTVKLAAAFSATAGNTLGRDYAWQFTAAVADGTPPTWQADSTLTVSSLAPTSLTLSWPAAGDNVAVTAYEVYQGNTLLAALDGETTSYDIGNLTANMDYTFCVYAVDYIGNRSDGLSVGATTPPPDTLAPSWPEGSLTFADLTAAGLTLNWTPSVDNYAVTAYRVYQDGGLLGTVDGATTLYFVTGLTGNTAYCFQVQAVDAAGNASTDGPILDVISAPDNEAPTWPEGSTLTATDFGPESLTLNWSAAADIVGVHAYNIYENGILLKTIDGNATTGTLTGLTVDTIYTFKVEAADIAGNESSDGPSLSQSTAISYPSNWGAGFDFDLVYPTSRNISVDGTQVNNKIPNVMPLADSRFRWEFDQGLLADSYPQSITLQNITDNTAVTLPVNLFTYKTVAEGSTLEMDVSGAGLEANKTYVLSMASGLTASDGSVLGMTYFWEFTTSAYNHTTIAVAEGGTSPDIWHQVPVGQYHLILRSDGTVWGWGDNEKGQLGDGSRINRSEPVMAAGLDHVIAIAADDTGISMALKDDGTVWTWGNAPLGTESNIDNFGRFGTQLTASLVPRQVVGHVGIQEDDRGRPIVHQNVPVGPITDAVAIACNNGTLMALKKDGTVWCWGNGHYNQHGQPGSQPGNNTIISPVQVSGLGNVKAIAEGGGLCYSIPLEGWNLPTNGTSYALKEDGTVWAWGWGYCGQLGTGICGPDIPVEQRSISNPPVQVHNLTDVIDISAYRDHCLALKADGSVWMWGNNIPTPYPVNSLDHVSAISAGYDNLFLKQDDTVWVQRVSQAYDRYGAWETYSYPDPAQIAGLDGTTAISIKAIGGLALKKDGTTWMISNDESSASRVTMDLFSDNQAPTWPESSTLTLSDVADTGLFLNWTTIAEDNTGIAGYAIYQDDVRIALVDVGTTTYFVNNLITGNTYTFKIEARDMAGNWSSSGPVLTKTMEPTTWTSLPGSGRLAIGSDFMLALHDDGTVWAWGANDHGQLGVSSDTHAYSAVPGQVPGLSEIIAVAAGNGYSAALKNDGTVWTWGNNEYAQLGDGSITHFDKNNTEGTGLPDNPVPTKVPGLSDIAALSAGATHILALKADGTVWAWGDDRYAALGDARLDSWTEETLNKYLSSDFDNPNAEWAVPEIFINYPIQVPDLSGIVGIAAGDKYSMVLKNDGTVWAWGDHVNSYSHIKVAEGIKALAPGSNSVMFLTESKVSPYLGTAARGYYNPKINCYFGDAKISDLTGIRSIAAGQNLSLALKEDGTVWAGGQNANGYGQADNGLVQIQGLENVVAIYAGDQNWAVLKADGTVVTLGNNSRGQIGDGTLTPRTLPTPSLMNLSDDRPVTVAGDVNGDNEVNILDVVKAANFALGKITPTAAQFNAADMNGDGEVNILDVMKIVNKALGR